VDIVEPLKTFLRVYETKSFSAFAKESGSSQPTVSRQIAALESRLGARLFDRTTRALTPTDEGTRFYDYAVRALEALAEAEASVGRGRGAATGTLRLACPVALGRLHVVPRMARFLARHPDVRLDLILSDAFVDLVEEGIDLSLRVGAVTAPGLIARRIGETRRVTIASPDYLQRRGTPDHPQDLARHDCVIYTRLATGTRWHFSGQNGPVEVDVDGRFRANNSEAVREAVLAGLGIGLVPVWLLSDEIGSGRVRVVLEDFEPARLPMNAVYTSRRFVPTKVRAMIDFLEAEYRLDPTLSDFRG